MAASDRKRRTLLRDCKYIRIARVVHHQRAKVTIANWLKAGANKPAQLRGRAEQFREMMADTEFEREVLDINADYLDVFAASSEKNETPAVTFTQGYEDFTVEINGVVVKPDIQCSVERINRNNKRKTGLLTTRYAKGKALNEEEAAYSSSLLFGVRQMIDEGDPEAPEKALCMTLDAFSATYISAPTNARSRFLNMQAACASISDVWDNIEPPVGAVLN